MARAASKASGTRRFIRFVLPRLDCYCIHEGCVRHHRVPRPAKRVADNTSSFLRVSA